MNLSDAINEASHSPQPHTIAGKRGDVIINGVTFRQIAECVLRGMLDGATHYDKTDTVNLDYHRLIDIIYKVEWLGDFDPMAIVQNASCHIEKVLGIYPNIPKLIEKLGRKGQTEKEWDDEMMGEIQRHGGGG